MLNRSLIRTGVCGLTAFSIFAILTVHVQAQDAAPRIEEPTVQLRSLKATLEAEMIDLEEVERHIAQLAQFYMTDPEGAFRARLPVSECTARAGADLCAALWPFYEDPAETARTSSSSEGQGQ